MGMRGFAGKALAVFAGLALGLFAPLQASAQDAANPAVTLAGGYLLGPRDEVEISVVGRDDYRAKIQVQPDGNVTLPLIGVIGAENRTLAQLRDDIRARLISGGYFTSPDILVTLTNAVSRYVVVLGEVGTPGVVPVDRVYSLSELIARAGGLRGVGTDIVTFTPAGGTSQKYSLKAIGTGAAADPAVNPGDRIFVAPPELFYIYGQVGAPGSYPIDEGLTIRRALARSGGLTALGTEKRVKLYRGDVVVRASLDEKVQPGDTIVVGERVF